MNTALVVSARVLIRPIHANGVTPIPSERLWGIVVGISQAKHDVWVFCEFRDGSSIMATIPRAQPVLKRNPPH
jgi:hypothetical protein